MLQIDIPVFSEFMKRLTRAPSAALLLDYDGTLAPFRVDRSHALPYCGMVSVLQRIADSGKTRLAIISGRPVVELKSLLAPLHVEIWGATGLERLMPDGSYTEAAIGREALELLSQAKAKIVQAGLMSMAEIKRGSIAMHWRGIPAGKAESAATLIRKLWRPFAGSPPLRLLDFDHGVELRVAHPDKGDAVSTILNEVGSQAQIAYLGDDFTDEDAFSALNGRGLNVLVRPEYRKTIAQAWLKPPGELAAFLESWLHHRS